MLALDTRFVPNDDSTAAVENKDGATPLYVVLGTLKDDGNGGHNARVINDASSERLGALAKEHYLVTLTLNPTEDASFSGDVGFGMGQNAVGAALQFLDASSMLICRQAVRFSVCFSDLKRLPCACGVGIICAAARGFRVALLFSDTFSLPP